MCDILLEDIYASVYLVKFDITLSRAEHQLGKNQSKEIFQWDMFVPSFDMCHLGSYVDIYILLYFFLLTH